MPHNCCVFECTKAGHRIVDGQPVSYHKFPDEKNKKLRAEWLRAIRRDVGKYFKLTEHTKICSLHFRESDFIQKPFRTQRNLVPDAVPSIFSWSSTPTAASQKKRPPPRKRLFEQPESGRECEEQVQPEVHVEETLEDQLRSENVKLENEITELKKQLNDANEKVKENEKLQEELKEAKTLAEDSLNFRLNTFKDDDACMEFYTGFTYSTFCVLYDLLDPGQNGENIELYTRTKCHNISTYGHEDHIYCDIPTSNKKGPPPILPFREQFFLTLVRLRTGFSEKHLGHLFGISASTVSRYVISWTNFMFLKLGSLNIWLDRETVDKTMPHSFKKSSLLQG